MIIRKSDGMIRTFIYVVLFLLSVTAILYATLWRKTGTGDIELHLFWTIQYAWKKNSGYYWYLIIGNIVLFIPFGVFLTLLTMRFRWQWTVIPGFFLSSFVEATQYFNDCGLCELDDILHNTWGAFLGYCISVIIWYFVGRGKEIKKRQVIISVVFLMATIMVFGILIAYKNPDWSNVRYVNKFDIFH